MNEGRIWVVDDEPNIRRLLSGVLGDEGYVCEAFSDAEGLRRGVASGEAPDLVLLDVCLPGQDGLDWLRERSGDAPTPVIMMSGHGSIDTALEAVRHGAVDFLEKPIAVERLLVSVQNALRLGRLRRENQRLRAGGGGTLLGDSPAMQTLRRTIDRAAPTDATVLVTGENGVGKELVARALHEGSPRAGRAFVRVNCAAIPRELLESELFGHERGAFSGAVTTRRGRFEMAQGGSILLDEIGDMEPGMQAKLLRVLEEREVMRVGGERALALDVRVIAATNQDLSAKLRVGSFREDLYYRLAVLPIAVPPLRERAEDVTVYARHFLERYRQEHGRGPQEVDPRALARLRRHAWPGNVRELRNLMERLVVMVDGDTIGEHDVEALLVTSPGRAASGDPGSGPLALRLEAVERAIIERTLRETRGNLAEAGRRLGLDRANLHRKVKRLGIERE